MKPMSTSPASAVAHSRASGPPPVSSAQVVLAVEPARRHRPRVLVVEVALLRRRDRVLVPRVAAVDLVAQRIRVGEHLLVFPVAVERVAEQDPQAQVDLDEVVGHELAVDDHAGRHEHLAAPARHRAVLEVAVVRVVERAPAAQQHAPPSDLLVAGHGLVHEVPQVVVHRQAALHELHVAHEPGVVVGEELDRGHRADAARVQRGRVHVAPLHQAEHLARVPADLQRLAVELAGERVERPHDVADGPEAVLGGVRGLGAVGLLQDARVGLRDHLLAVVHPDQVLLEDVVVEHVLGGLAEVDDPLAEVRRAHPVGHVLVVDRAGGVVVAADPADPAGDEVRVARVLALHEDRVAAEDRRRRVALDDLLLREIDLRVDPEAADDPGDRVPRHLDEAGLVGRNVRGLRLGGRHAALTTPSRSRWSARCPACATVVPCRASSR